MIDPRAARFRPLEEHDTLLLRCGWPHTALVGQLCPGALAIARAYDQYAAPRLTADDGTSVWLLSAPREGTGLRQVRPSVFEVMLPRRDAQGRELPRRGRRKMIFQHQTDAQRAKGGRWIKGATPSLPAVIICPRCGRPNRAADQPDPRTA